MRPPPPPHSYTQSIDIPRPNTTRLAELTHLPAKKTIGGHDAAGYNALITVLGGSVSLWYPHDQPPAVTSPLHTG